MTKILWFKETKNKNQEHSVFPMNPYLIFFHLLYIDFPYSGFLDFFLFVFLSSWFSNPSSTFLGKCLCWLSLGPVVSGGFANWLSSIVALALILPAYLYQLPQLLIVSSVRLFGLWLNVKTLENAWKEKSNLHAIGSPWARCPSLWIWLLRSWLPHNRSFVYFHANSLVSQWESCSTASNSIIALFDFCKMNKKLNITFKRTKFWWKSMFTEIDNCLSKGTLFHYPHFLYNLRLYKTYESKASWFQTLFSLLPYFF